MDSSDDGNSDTNAEKLILYIHWHAYVHEKEL